jgi:hypothetical protein
MEAYMTLQLLIFIAAMIYLCWAFVRYWKRRNRKDGPFIEVVENKPVSKPYRQRRVEKKKESDADREWRKRVQDEIEDMTK